MWFFLTPIEAKDNLQSRLALAKRLAQAARASCFRGHDTQWHYDNTPTDNLKQIYL